MIKKEEPGTGTARFRIKIHMQIQARWARTLLPLFLCVTAAFGQYKTEPAGAPPAEVADAMKVLLPKQGVKISSPRGPLYEVWLVSALPAGPKSKEENLTLPEVPHGSFLGVIRILEKQADRRGDQMKPGLYTMRYSYFPVNGQHQGIAPQRDFLVLSDAATDKDAAGKPEFNALMSQSEKAAGMPHPLVLSFWKQDADFTPGLAKSGDRDWVYQTKIGDTPVAIILVGVTEG